MNPPTRGTSDQSTAAPLLPMSCRRRIVTAKPGTSVMSEYCQEEEGGPDAGDLVADEVQHDTYRRDDELHGSKRPVLGARRAALERCVLLESGKIAVNQATPRPGATQPAELGPLTSRLTSRSTTPRTRVFLRRARAGAVLLRLRAHVLVTLTRLRAGAPSPRCPPRRGGKSCSGATTPATPRSERCGRTAAHRPRRRTHGSAP
jgi:hypothetical protein